MGFLSSLLPSDTKFFSLFEAVAANLRSAAAHLDEYSEIRDSDSDDADRLSEQIKDLEHANDTATHQIFSALHRSFIIPFDREDIHALAASLDDILDYATYTVQRASAYKISQPSEAMSRQLKLLAQAILSVCDIVERLRDLKNISEISPYLQEVHRIENEGDSAYMAALEELFSGKYDALTVIKWKDLHHLAETAVDRCERAADVAEGIAIKHA